ncbi:uncharacterized protein LOC133196140 [Saccostrea echinata]|uniref:uncharacterized protein LOC133196140 n=1 Tax=Saccostrea echinata TaxID=191078 RepID=UPI002A83D69D|nr:uncharacterized protein LOC133196140 [Saccostrea echinata]
MASRLGLADLLEEIGLQTLIHRFQEEKVELSDIQSLSDADLNRLGVSTIGDRVRLRSRAIEEPSWPSTSGSAPVPAPPPSGLRPPFLTADNVRKERDLLFHSRKRKNRNELGQPTQGKKQRGRSWTVSVMCLSDKNCNFVPNSEVKECLLKAGLGLKKIKFNVNDGQTEVLEKISSNEKDNNNECVGFPALKNCGGFELMRSQSNNRSLSTIKVEWSVKNLKACIGSQGKLYVRPIQRNLSTEPIQLAHDETAEKSMLKTEICRECGQPFAIAELRAHCELCIGEHFTSNETEDKKEEIVPEDLPDPLIETLTDSIPVTEIMAIPISSGSGNIVLETITDSIPVTETIAIPISTSSGNIVFSDPSAFISSLSFTATEPAETLKHEEENFTESIPNSIQSIVDNAITYCKQKHIEDPVEILKYLQSTLVTGRKLDIEDLSSAHEGDTNYICVDRSNILETAFEEIKGLQDLRLTLEVQFYGEIAADFGGPRKEFFQLALLEIREKYFDHGLREHIAEDYLLVGKILALSILQNGKLPKFLDENMQNLLFSELPAESASITNLRAGLDSLGLYKVGVSLPTFRYLLQPSSTKLTVKSIIHLLCPKFAEEGSNTRRYENSVYAAFTKYLREVESGRRMPLTLNHILQFVTGASEEPVLGFFLHPSIEFVCAMNSFLPTANTCSNSLKLPRPTGDLPLPSHTDLFNLYDYAFSNTYFGLF